MNNINPTLTYLSSHYNSFLTGLAALVNVDCGTHNKASVDIERPYPESRIAYNPNPS